VSKQKQYHPYEQVGAFNMQKYTIAKSRNQLVKKYAKNYVSERMQKHVCECGNWLDFIVNYDEDRRKLMAANFCKWRFCPMCAMRKALVDAQRISVLMTYLNQVHGKSFIMVTFTAPNVEADKLHDEITKFNLSFKNFTKRKEISSINKGYIRKLEITYNRERNDYHPHFHVVFAVNPSYFKSRGYVKQTAWLDIWRECMGDDSITQVDVRKFKPKDNGDMSEGFNGAEFAKYFAKDEDYTLSCEVFDAFYTALKGRQQLTYNGLFAMANKKYKADELVEYIKSDDTDYFWQLVYTWKGKEYKEKTRRKLDATDKLWLNMRGISVDTDDTTIED